MTTVYLKTMKPLGEDLSSVIKITPKGVLYVTKKTIEIDGFTLDSIVQEVDWYKRKIKAVDTTKQEFVNFYIDTVARINKLSKL